MRSQGSSGNLILHHNYICHCLLSSGFSIAFLVMEVGMQSLFSLGMHTPASLYSYLYSFDPHCVV